METLLLEGTAHVPLNLGDRARARKGLSAHGRAGGHLSGSSEPNSPARAEPLADPREGSRQVVGVSAGTTTILRPGSDKFTPRTVSILAAVQRSPPPYSGDLSQSIGIWQTSRVAHDAASSRKGIEHYQGQNDGQAGPQTTGPQDYGTEKPVRGRRESARGTTFRFSQEKESGRSWGPA
jgi:hypothetical protein